MSNSGGRSPQSVDEMLVTMEKTKNDQLTKYPGKSTYRRDNSEHSKHEIQKMLSLSIAEMADYGTKQPVRMEDTETIKTRTILYLKCCQETATIPSMIGLCRSIGYTDRAARYWRRKHADHPTALWLESFAELCAECLAQSSLQGNVNAIVGIFVLKSCHGWRETSEVVLSPGEAGAGMEENSYNADEIRRRYLIDTDDTQEDE